MSTKHRRFLLPLIAYLLMLTSCTQGGDQSAASGTRVPSSITSTTPVSLETLVQNEQRLLMTPHPAYDLYKLALRFNTSGATSSLLRVARTTPLNAHVGQEDRFWISNPATHNYTTIRARLVYVTPHVYMYVEDAQAFNSAALQSSADLFEHTIYPNEHNYFGNEWSPGIDDDVHLTLLNVAGLANGSGGYFSSNDEYPRSINPHSNEREMLYLNLNTLIPGSPDYNSALAHEFQQMIHWYRHPADSNWIDQGMSMLAQHVNGFPVDGVDSSFMRAPDTQLNAWSGDTSSAISHYGASYLFMDYFAEHYGGPQILQELLSDPALPPLNFDHVLAKHGYRDRFSDVLHNWYIANFVNDAQSNQAQYGYPSIVLPGLTPQHKYDSYPIANTGTVHQYAAEYYDFLAARHQGTLSISLKGTPIVSILDNAAHPGGNQWWSNRYNNMDSTLTRGFDLSHLKGKHVALQFSSWFDLERDKDYAFVEVSTDGTHWTTLKGSSTVEANPDGVKLGNGFTGVSGGGKTPQWLQEHVDLSPYAGKKIQLRFEQITHEAGHLQGFALGGISIPALHFKDTLASDNGWVSNGFFRSNNALPEHYFMQALVYQDHQFTIRDVDIDLATGQGKLLISGFGLHVDRVVLIVSASATETTQLAHYQISASLL